jgi:hypothetical protein
MMLSGKAPATLPSHDSSDHNEERGENEGGDEKKSHVIEQTGEQSAVLQEDTSGGIDFSDPSRNDEELNALLVSNANSPPLNDPGTHQVASLKAWVENTPEKFNFRTFSNDNQTLKQSTVESMARPWTPTAKKVQSKREEWDRLCSKFLQYLELSDLCNATQACRPWARLIAQHRLKRRCVLHSAVPRRVRKFFWQHSAPCRPRRERMQYQQLLKRERDLRLGQTPIPAADADKLDAENKPDNIDAPSTSAAALAGAGDADPVSPRTRKQQVLQCYEVFVEINADVRRTFGRSGMKVRDSGQGNSAASAATSAGASERGGEGAAIGSSTSSTSNGCSSCFMTAVDGYRLQDFDNSTLSVAEKQRRLRNVLLAYSTLNEEVGYCQGMNYLVSLLLSNVAWDEEEAFWLLVLLMEQYEMLHIYRPGMQHLELRFHQFEKLLDVHMPTLANHLDKHGLHPSMFASGWFITLFSNFNTLSPPVVAHILDIFFMDGWKVIFRVALAIMSRLQDALMQADLENMIRIFYGFSTTTTNDSAGLLEDAMQFKVTESILQDMTEEFHQAKKNRRNSKHGGHP